MRRGGARFQLAREFGIERGYAEVDRNQLLRRHLAQDVDIALDQRRLGDDRHRVAKPLQHLEQRARDLQLALDRLVGVGIDADCNRPTAVTGLAQLVIQQRRRVRLAEQPGLEIEAGRQAEISVRRPGEAVDAAVLAAAVRIDRAVEGQVRRLVVGQDAARGVLLNLGFRPRNLEWDVPAVVERLALPRLEAPAGVADRAAALYRSRVAVTGFVHQAVELSTLRERRLKVPVRQCGAAFSRDRRLPRPAG